MVIDPISRGQNIRGVALINLNSDHAVERNPGYAT
jgi:hypothetical protein